MPLSATYTTKCDGCGKVKRSRRDVVKGEHAPLAVVPPEWTQDKAGVWCPACTAAREA